MFRSISAGCSNRLLGTTKAPPHAKTITPGTRPGACFLFRGVWCAGGEESRQSTNIPFALGAFGWSFAGCRAAAARAAFARFASFAFDSLDRLLGSGLRGGWLRRRSLNRCRRLCACSSRSRLGLLLGWNKRARLLNFAFRAETLAARATVAPVPARLALTILPFAWRTALTLLAWLLPFAFGLLFAFSRHILLLRLLLLGRGEARVHLGHIIVEIVVLLPFGSHAVLRLLGAGNDAEIMFGMLQIVFCHHRVTARLSIASQLQIFLRDMGSVAADLYVRAIALEIA